MCAYIPEAVDTGLNLVKVNDLIHLNHQYAQKFNTALKKTDSPVAFRDISGGTMLNKKS